VYPGDRRQTVAVVAYCACSSKLRFFSPGAGPTASSAGQSISVFSFRRVPGLLAQTVSGSGARLFRNDHDASHRGSQGKSPGNRHFLGEKGD
jgi:hypothetical protein